MSSSAPLIAASELERRGVLLIQDGNHGEYRPLPTEFVDFGTSFVRAADLDGGQIAFSRASRINATALARIRKGIGKPGDTILSHKGTVGRVAFASLQCEPFVCSPQTTFWRSLDEHVLDRRYLFAYLRSPVFQQQLDALMHESDMAPYVSLTVQRTLKVLLPPIAEQRRIAGALGALDDKIGHNATLAKHLEAFARLIFERGFSDKLERCAAIPLGEAVGVIETGRRPKGGVSSYKTGVPSVGAESILGLGLFDYSKTKYVPNKFFAEMKTGRVSDRDVLLYKDGGRPGMFEPHVTLVGEGFPFSEFCINEHVYRLRVREPYTQEFLYFWLTSDVVMEEMRRRGTGVAIPGLNSTALRGLPLPVLDAAELVSFTEKVKDVVTLVLRNSAQARKLEQLRDLLVPGLISGRIRVPDSFDPDDVLGTIAEQAGIPA